MSLSKNICFVTGNAGKLAAARRYLEPLGFSIEGKNLDIIEPQLDKIEDVALSKARQAYSQLGKAVLVEDSGFYIEALNNFPGPYTKYVIETIGIEMLLKMMAGEKNRNSMFFSVAVYIDDDDGSEHIFTSKRTGYLAIEPDKSPLRDDAYSDLWKIYIPTGETESLNALTDENRTRFYKRIEKDYSFTKFADWFL